MSEQNKAFVRRLMEEVIGRGNFALVEELVAADYVGHSSSPEINTREGHSSSWSPYARRFRTCR
jgi:hypothetical protein